jgi:hypothetical protein
MKEYNFGNLGAGGKLGNCKSGKLGKSGKSFIKDKSGSFKSVNKGISGNSISILRFGLLGKNN